MTIEGIIISFKVLATIVFSCAVSFFGFRIFKRKNKDATIKKGIEEIRGKKYYMQGEEYNLDEEIKKQKGEIPEVKISDKDNDGKKKPKKAVPGGAKLPNYRPHAKRGSSAIQRKRK